MRAFLILKTAEAAEGPSAEVHRRSLTPENVGSSKKKWKLGPTKPKKAAIRIKNDYDYPSSLGSSLRQNNIILTNSVPRTSYSIEKTDLDIVT